MSSDSLSRFLSMLERELAGSGRAQARIELSHHELAPDAIWANMERGLRVVVELDPPRDVEAERARLALLAGSFSGLVAEAELPSVRPPPRARAEELDEALELLAHRARAASAWVIDDSTPEIWGGSLAHEGVDLEAAALVARLARLAEEVGLTPDALEDERPELRRRLSALGERPGLDVAQDLARLERLALDAPLRRALCTLAAHRERAPSVSVSRRFAGIYDVVLAFDGPFSGLHAEAALLRALPWIEQLVTSLPPRDPVGKGAKIAVLRRLRSV